mmetsp:Transcript_33236/g.86130  ORF Transcript_33236/g.86130 Transcript_33236/m.86130 type:complete len:253 (-) Transcript_33236:391-1149(-)
MAAASFSPFACSPLASATIIFISCWAVIRLAWASACISITFFTFVDSASAFARCRDAVASRIMTPVFPCASIMARSLLLFATISFCCMDFSSIHFFPSSCTFICSVCLFTRVTSCSEARFCSAILNSNSLTSSSSFFLILVVVSKDSRRSRGSLTSVTMQRVNCTPVSSNFLFRVSNMLPAAFPRNVYTSLCVRPRTRRRMPSSTHPVNISSKRLAPNLYTKSSALAIKNTKVTSTSTITLSPVGHVFTGAL